MSDELTDERIESIYTQETGSLIDDSPWALLDFSRAIESAATAPLLERIAALELKIETSVLDSPALIARIAELEARVEQGKNIVRGDMKRIAELDQYNNDLHADVQRFREHAMNEKDARMALEADRNSWEQQASDRTDDALKFIDERDAALSMVAELERKLEGARVDAARLDHIEQNARCDPKMDGQHVWWPTSFNSALKGPTLRAAIDAALTPPEQPK